MNKNKSASIQKLTFYIVHSLLLFISAIVSFLTLPPGTDFIIPGFHGYLVTTALVLTGILSIILMISGFKHKIAEMFLNILYSATSILYFMIIVLIESLRIGFQTARYRDSFVIVILLFVLLISLVGNLNILLKHMLARRQVNTLA